MALLATQSVIRTGTAQTLAAPSATDTFVPGGRTFYVATVGVTTTVFTFKVPTTRDVIPYVDISDLVIGTFASLTKIFGPFPT